MTDPKSFIEDTLKAQRCFILSLQHMGLNPIQMEPLREIYKMNQRLVYIMGLDVPEMSELMKQAEQVAELERLYGKEEYGDQEDSDEG